MLRFFLGNAKWSLIAFIVFSATAGAQGGKAIAPDVTTSGESRRDVIGALTGPRVQFLFPKDGATVGRTFTAKFAVHGLKTAASGTIEPGTGHFHIVIDKPAVKAGEIIPMDENHMHFGKGETEAVIKLAPGEHTLTLQFSDGTHRAYGDALVQTIKVKVK